jgi:Fic-DOC domain mobile mystery protein B
VPQLVYPDGATPLDPDEMCGLRHPHVSTRQQLNELEQANVQAGLDWLKRRRRSDILSEEFLRLLHLRLFGKVWSWAGGFRTTEKNIGVDPAQIQVQLRALLDDTRHWLLHNVYRPSEAALRFHHRLVLIHPFPNGNGRHARIAADALLEKELGLPPIDWNGGLDLAEISGPRRQQYIAALRAADAHDYGPLIAFMGAREDLG